MDRILARRAYRKRVASIVCAKWIEFSAQRLRAFRHHRRKLGLSALSAFVHAVQLNRELLLRARAFQSKLRYSWLSLLMRAWSLITQRTRTIRQLVASQQSRRSSAVCAGTLRHWQGVVLRQHKKRKLQSKAQFFHDLMLSNGALRAWKQFHRGQHNKTLLKARAVVHNSTALQAKGWDVWCWYLRHRAVKTTQLAAARHHHQTRGCLAWFRRFRVAQQQLSLIHISEPTRPY